MKNDCLRETQSPSAAFSSLMDLVHSNTVLKNSASPQIS